MEFYNAKYGGLNIKADNVIFANAVEDPWQYAGMRKVEDPDSQKNLVAVLIDCNNCGHCADLYTPKDTDAPSLTRARNQIKDQLIVWLNAASQQDVLFLQ